MTLIEIAVAMTILTVCCGMLTSTISGTMAHNRTKRERQMAVEAARAVIEDMHNVDFYEVFRQYNHDPTDDGAEGEEGTAPGPYFEVEGLSPTSDDPDGFVGEIVMPATERPLLESIEHETLGFPRDLNGDMQIDELDHANDFIILPVQVRVEWQGVSGKCSLELNTMLADIRKVD
jgi:hypothetical protein